MPEADKRDMLFEGSDRLFSLNKFVGKKINDLLGYPSTPFAGTTEAVFVVSKIVFEDGVIIDVGGEHDLPFIPASAHLRNMDEKTLQRFIDAS